MSVDIVARSKGKKVSTRRLKSKAIRILKLLKENQSELSLALVGNREIRKLNSQYRNKNEPTDVLSFPLEQDLPKGEKLLGDVVISVEQAEKQAEEEKKTLEQELEFLLIHGILHLLGFDHEVSPKEASRMHRMEKRIQRALCDPKRLRL
jgi:rRNA maturation RNase YbeY